MGLDFENLYGRNTIGNTVLSPYLLLLTLLALVFLSRSVLFSSWVILELL
jgi:hypothetical protein